MTSNEGLSSMKTQTYLRVLEYSIKGELASHLHRWSCTPPSRLTIVYAMAMSAAETPWMNNPEFLDFAWRSFQAQREQEIPKGDLDLQSPALHQSRATSIATQIGSAI